MPILDCHERAERFICYQSLRSWDHGCMAEPYVTTGTAARALGVGHVTLLRWAHAGAVTPAYRTPGGQFRWDLDDLRRQLRAGSPTETGEPMTEPASTPEPQPVAAAIVTSPRGVLAGRRNDGKPPWTFIAGEVEPGETAPFAAVREVKEETGLEVRAGREIGRRVHPKTGRTMIYIAAEPVRPDDLDVFVGDERELAEVRWLTLAKADELLPGMFPPVRAHLGRTLQGHTPI